MRWFRRILSIVLVGALFYGALRFSSENAQLVAIDYVAGQTAEIALWQALALAAGAGALLSALPLGFLWTRSRLLAWQYRRAMGRQQSEIHQLRNLPLAPAESAAPKGALDVADPPISRGALDSGT